jgi:hypothetical protein
LQLFPTGKVLSPRWRFLLWGTSVSLIVLILGIGFTPGPIEDLRFVDNPFGLSGTWGAFFEAAAGIGWLLTMVCLLLSVASIVLRWRRSRGDERQQLKWLATAGLALLLAMAAAVPTNRWEILIVPLAGVPLAAGIAILKYRLYDIDVVINKTIVFGSLAAFITGIYVAIVVGIGTLLGSPDEPNLVLSIAATAIVAIAFSPVKERTQRLANRLVYGHRLSPYEVLTDLSRTVATAPTPNEVLAGVAHAATLGVNGKGTTVTLNLHDGSEVKEHFPPDESSVTGSPEIFEVTHESERLGEISVRKGAADPLTVQDRKLLEDLSAQAGLALHNARLALELRASLDEISAQADELQESRTRIVSAADESRRRLEKDITRGPRKDLLALPRELESVSSMVASDPKTAARRLESLAKQANTTLDGLRELARGIYPPLLADKGIVAALESHIRKQELSIDVRAGDEMRAARFEDSIETTMYFCCAEVLGGNDVASVDIAVTGDELLVRIDGAAIDPRQERNLKDRIEAQAGRLEVQSNVVVFRLPIGDGSRSQAEAVAHAVSSSSGPN